MFQNEEAIVADNNDFNAVEPRLSKDMDITNVPVEKIEHTGPKGFFT